MSTYALVAPRPARNIARYGILIGDGRLNYRNERVIETYYAFNVIKSVTVSFDYQFIADPGYNADRGPVSVFSTRLHAEF